MRKLRWVPALLLGAALGACNESLLDVNPVDEIPEDVAIIDSKSANAALMGAYSALQSGSLYGGDLVLWTETLTDNVEHTGTFEGYADGDLLFMRPDMGVIGGIWTDLYDGINRVNLLIQMVPEIEDMDPAEADVILGQAYALRALQYFQLVRSWGDVPLVLEPPASLDEAAQVSRDPVSAVYDQIEADLALAQTMLAGMSNDDRTFVTPGFVTALQARVALYQEDWATAASRAEQLVASGDYSLPANPRAAFTPNGDPSTEDVFRVAFTAVDWNNEGYYYMFDGRFEIGATQTIYDLFEPGDLRFNLDFSGVRPDGIEVIKFPTPVGAEDIHVIRYAEVLLILAEALAERGTLEESIVFLNQVRNRAGLAGYTLGVDLDTQQDVLDAVYLERRLELAFEGEYWYDLVRTGRAAEVLGSRFDPHEAIWPIPQNERDVAPNLTQNPGY